MKKILALILALSIVLLCPLTIAGAAEDYDHLPQIYINGIASRVVYEVDDPNKTPIYYPSQSTDTLMQNFANIGQYIDDAVKQNNPDILTEAIYSIMWDTMGKSALEPDGVTNQFNVTTDPCYASQEYKGNGKYNFCFDCRLDPVDIAAQLYEFVQDVKEITGSERYEMVSSSFGGCVAAAYLHEYEEEWKNIDSFLLCCPALPGIDFIGELFRGTFNFDPDVLVDFADASFGNEDINLILNVLNKSGALEKILEYGLEPVVQLGLMRAVKKVVHDIVGTFPSSWSYVQDKYFYDALENIYGEDYASPDHSHAKLIEKITYYHEEVMVDAPELLLRAQEKGIHVAIIAKYGFVAMPLSEAGNVLSDNLMDLVDVTYGATCSMRDETLPDDYTQKLYPEYNMISIDRCVDMSTALLPFTTWVIRDFYHEENNAAYWKMTEDIVYNNLDINSTPEYPQFMQKSTVDGNLLEPMTLPAEEEETTLLQDFFRLLTRFIQILTEKLKELFGI